MTDADAGHRLRLGCARQADRAGRQRLDGAAALRPRPDAGPARRHATSTARNSRARWPRRGTSCPPPDAAHPLVVVTAAGSITGNSVLQRAHRGPDRRAGVRAAGTRRRTGARGPAGALRPRAASRRGATCASTASEIPADATAVRVVAEDLSLTPGRLDRGHAAAGARTALGAGVRRLDPAGADGLGGRSGVPVPAADAARQRRHRGPEVPHHAGLQRQEAGHRHLAGRPQRRPARHHRPAAAAHRDGDLPVPRLGPGLGFAAQVRHHRRRPARRDRPRAPRPAAGCGHRARSGSSRSGRVTVDPWPTA